MTLDMETHMHSYVAPSVANAAENAAKSQGITTHTWLAHVYACQRAGETGGERFEALNTEALALSEDSLINAVTEHTIQVGETTNSGHRFYLTASGLTVRWCSEDEMLAWHS